VSEIAQGSLNKQLSQTKSIYLMLIWLIIIIMFTVVYFDHC